MPRVIARIAGSRSSSRCRRGRRTSSGVHQHGGRVLRSDSRTQVDGTPRHYSEVRDDPRRPAHDRYRVRPRSCHIRDRKARCEGHGTAWAVGRAGSRGSSRPAHVVTDRDTPESLAEPVKELRAGRGRHVTSAWARTKKRTSSRAIWSSASRRCRRPGTTATLNAPAPRAPITTEIGLLVERPRATDHSVTDSAAITTMRCSPTPSAAGGGVGGGGRAPHGEHGGRCCPRRTARPDDLAVLELVVHAALAGAHKRGGKRALTPPAVLTNIRENHLDRHGSFEHHVETVILRQHGVGVDAGWPFAR